MSTEYGQPCIMLGKHKEFGVAEIGKILKPHEEAVCHDRDATFSLHVYKNPKDGAKPARVVPIYTNCGLSEEGFDYPRGYSLPSVLGAYRHMAWGVGVDPCNALALGLRETNRHTTWSRALRSFVLRYSIANTYTACKQLGLICRKTSMWKFQLGLLHAYIPPVDAPDVHVPSSVGVNSNV